MNQNTYFFTSDEWNNKIYIILVSEFLIMKFQYLDRFLNENLITIHTTLIILHLHLWQKYDFAYLINLKVVNDFVKCEITA